MVLVVKIPPAKEGDMRDTGSIPGSGRSPGGKHDNPLQYSTRESHGQRSLAGCIPWNRRESGMTDTCTHTVEIRMGITHPAMVHLSQKKAQGNFQSWFRWSLLRCVHLSECTESILEIWALYHFTIQKFVSNCTHIISVHMKHSPE